jgi:hypothetical protein
MSQRCARQPCSFLTTRGGRRPTRRQEGAKHHDRRTDADNPKVFYTPSASGLSSADHAEPGAHASRRHEQAARPFMRDGVRAHEDPVAGTASASTSSTETSIAAYITALTEVRHGRFATSSSAAVRRRVGRARLAPERGARPRASRRSAAGSAPCGTRRARGCRQPRRLLPCGDLAGPAQCRSTVASAADRDSGACDARKRRGRRDAHACSAEKVHSVQHPRGNLAIS